MSLYKRGDVWWIDLEHRGKRVRRSTGCREKEAAEDVHAELAARLRRQRLISAHTWHDAQAAWLEASPRDDADKYRLWAFNRAYRDRPLSEVTSAGIVAAIHTKAASTFNRYVNLILAILNNARANGWMQEVPKLARRKEAPGRLRWLTAEEWAALDAALPDHLRPLARFAVATGLREHNVTHLEWSQVDVRRRVAWIHPDQAKGRQAIGVPLNDDALAVLTGQLEQLRARQERRKAAELKHERVNRSDRVDGDRWVFLYRGAPMAKIADAWREALQRAGLGYFKREPNPKNKSGETITWHSDVDFHTLRHTWASWHVMNGTALAVLQKLGGWATIQMVNRYAHLAPEHLAAAAGNARPVSIAVNAEEKKIA